MSSDFFFLYIKQVKKTPILVVASETSKIKRDSSLMRSELGVCHPSNSNIQTMISRITHRGEFGGEWIHVYIWLSSFAIHLKLSHC